MLTVSTNEQLMTELCMLAEQLHYWKSKAESLEQLTLIDELTECGNRRKFDNDLARQLQRCARENQDISIVFFDLDGLKSANDIHGHEYGDMFIVRASQAVKKVLRGYDELYRWGGDEFAIILECSLDTAKVVAERVRKAVCSARDDEGRFFGSASVGAASANPVLSSPQQLLNNADFAQKMAKQSGKNRVCWSIDNVG